MRRWLALLLLARGWRRQSVILTVSIAGIKRLLPLRPLRRGAMACCRRSLPLIRIHASFSVRMRHHSILPIAVKKTGFWRDCLARWGQRGSFISALMMRCEAHVLISLYLTFLPVLAFASFMPVLILPLARDGAAICRQLIRLANLWASAQQRCRYLSMQIWRLFRQAVSVLPCRQAHLMPPRRCLAMIGR